ncbi:MAG: hypothetical protein L0170_03680, partial [Acidobacteria bacterium]|nr:hypothetical protein [Acidobacteriota bacterium]
MSGSSQTQQLLNKATALYHSGDYRQAIQVWQELLSQDPQNQRALEGIRMASLLLEEAQTGESSTPIAGESAASETPEVIAKVREGIQKVRSFLSLARYMDAMEVCQALLQLAPRSEAVREVLEEARDAYEAQPFIDEHLEIARQLFVQERLDEATAEIQKIFFLSANHGEAKKLEAKIEALRQKRSPDTEPSAPTAPASPSGADTRQLQMPPDFGEALDLPQESPEPAISALASGSETSAPSDPSGHVEPVLNEDWEAELAQLGFEASDPQVKPPQPAPVEEPLPLTDLSEQSSLLSPHSTPARKAPSQPDQRKDSRQPLPEMDLGELARNLAEEESGRAAGKIRPPRSEERSTRRGPRVRPAVSPGGGISAGKLALGVLLLLALSAGGWWMIGALLALLGEKREAVVPRDAATVVAEGVAHLP